MIFNSLTTLCRVNRILVFLSQLVILIFPLYRGLTMNQLQFTPAAVQLVTIFVNLLVIILWNNCELNLLLCKCPDVISNVRTSSADHDFPTDHYIIDFNIQTKFTRAPETCTT